MRTQRNTLLSTALLLLLAATARAQSGTTDANAAGAASGTSDMRAADAGAVASSNVTASASVRARSKADRLENIKEKGAKTAAGKLSKADSKLRDAANRVQNEAEATAGTIIANRLAGEFNTTAEVLVKQEGRHSCGWGNLVIAHTLASNSRGEVTTDELIELNHQPVGWAQIAAGLGYRLDDVVSAVKVESRVARGTMQADGRVAAVRPEAPRQLGANVGASMEAGAAAGRSSVGAGVGVNAGASATLPKVKAGN